MDRRLHKASLLLAGSLLACAAVAGEHGAELRGVITGAEPGIGQITASLFDAADDYLQSPRLEQTQSVNTNGEVMLNFGEQPPGEYALVVFYDRNTNGKLDTGFLGIPKEKVGFSNNARGRFGPAKWADARFVLGDAAIDVHIALTSAK